MTGNRFDSLDGLRGVAALSVLLHHLFQQYYTTVTGANNRVFSWMGGWGVSLFFVLSGFCIHYSQAQRRHKGIVDLDYKHFAISRIFRIVPGYYAAILICMFVGMYSETNLINLPTTTGDVIGHMLFVHNLYPSGLYSINGVFWSIAIEFQFYIFYALLYKWFNFKLSQLLGFIVIALIFYGCASCFMRLENNWRIIGQHLFITTFWSWYLGALIAEWSINSKIKDYLLLRTSNSIGINIILLFVISLNLFCSVGDPVLFRLHYIYWIVPIFSALLIFILAIMDGCETLIVGMFKKLKWIGAISYSLYLLHPVGIALALKIFGPLSLFSQFMAIAFSFTLAILSYLLIEKPFMRLQKSLK